MPADPTLTAALRAACDADRKSDGASACHLCEGVCGNANIAAAIAAFLRAMPELRFPNGEIVARWSPNAAEHVAAAVEEAARDAA